MGRVGGQTGLAWKRHRVRAAARVSRAGSRRAVCRRVGRRVDARVVVRRARCGRFGRARGAAPVRSEYLCACVGERAGVESHRKPGEVVICRVQKKVHRDTAPPMAAQMG